jgi:Swt1-like HEPN
MDITQALKDTENSLRDFIAGTLQKAFGKTWIEKCGVSQAKMERWKKRKADEFRRQESGVVDERLLYYADFYDIKTILKTNWNKVPELPAALGNWQTIEVWLSELEKLRDPDAHRRELLPHQKNLVLGVTGEIRNRLIRYRSKKETADDYFPQIESARDSLGNIWTPESRSRVVKTRMTLRVGDRIDFVITAADPLGEALNYAIITKDRDRFWQHSNELSWEIAPDQVGKDVHTILLISSNREHYAYDFHDDEIVFKYDVIPPKP